MCVIPRLPAEPLRRGALLVLLALAGGAVPGAAAAQEPEPAESADSRIIYRREVFQYPRGGRPDPFRSLLGTGALGVRVEDVTLRGVVHDPDPRQSVAILVVAGSDRPIRARVGDRVGGMRILAIHPRRVDLLVEEFGVSRRESLHLRTTPEPGAGS
ncbi:hypothetical protein BH23GEM4_BH23GEM4_19660 [soil metagenome]